MENEKLFAVPQEGDKIVKRLHIKLKDIGLDDYRKLNKNSSCFISEG